MHKYCDFFDSCSYSGDWTDIIVSCIIIFFILFIKSRLQGKTSALRHISQNVLDVGPGVAGVAAEDVSAHKRRGRPLKNSGISSTQTTEAFAQLSCSSHRYNMRKRPANK